MVKVNIKRVLDNVIGWSAIFETEQEAINWVSSEIANKSWGRPERWVKADINDILPHGENKEAAEDVRVVQIFGKNINEYFFKADYTVELINVRLLPKLQALRSERNARLYECDWTQLVDAPLTSEKRQQWAQYRQELRDIFQSDDLDVNSVNWPTKPN